MTARPGTIKAEVAIPLERPRSHEPTRDGGHALAASPCGFVRRRVQQAAWPHDRATIKAEIAIPLERPRSHDLGMLTAR